MRGSVDYDQIRRTDQIVDPLRRAPARQCRKIETDRLGSELPSLLSKILDLGDGAEVVDVPDCVRQAVLSLTERVPARMGGAQEVNEIIPFLPFSQK